MRATIGYLVYKIIIYPSIDSETQYIIYIGLGTSLQSKTAIGKDGPESPEFPKVKNGVVPISLGVRVI